MRQNSHILLIYYFIVDEAHFTGLRLDPTQAQPQPWVREAKRLESYQALSNVYSVNWLGPLKHKNTFMLFFS